MNKYYLVAAFILMFGLNLLYKSGVPGGAKAPALAPREPANAAKAPDQSNTPTPPQLKTETENRIWLREEATRVGHIEPKPGDTLEMLRQRASRLTTADRIELKTVAVSSDQPADERFLAVFVLSEAPGDMGVDQLQAISENPISQKANDRSYSDELVIRMQALEAAVKKLSPNDAKSFLHGYVSRVQDPQLAKHARYLQK